MTDEAAGCVFCGIRDGNIPADFVHTDERAFAIRDINPLAPVHILVIPREHIPTASVLAESQLSIMASLTDVANRVAVTEGVSRSGYRLVINVGPDAHMSVAHLHMHVLGGRDLGAGV